MSITWAVVAAILLSYSLGASSHTVWRLGTRSLVILSAAARVLDDVDFAHDELF